MSKKVDLLQGNVFRSLTVLALPIMGSQLVQMAYNLVDMIWLGRLNAGAVAAAGAAGMFSWLANGLAVLPRMGGQVLVAQNIGAKDMKQAGRYAAAALQMTGVLALAYTLLLTLCATPLIGFFRLNDPVVVQQAKDYLIIVGAGMAFTFLNAVLVAIITATGNSRTPFLAMLCGLGINMVLDPMLIFGIGPFPEWGVVGAAVATVLAQAIVTALLVVYAIKDEYLFPLVKLTQRATTAELKAIVVISGPAAFMNILFPLISMVISRIIAAWGDGAIAAQKVGSQIESISWMTADGFAAATSSFVAQNFGAGNLKRAKQGIRISYSLITVWGLFCTALLIFAAEPIFKLFIFEPEVLPMGVDYLMILGLSELFMCWEILAEGIYSGFGRTVLSSTISTVFTALRIPLALALSATALALNGVWWSISISSILKGLFISFALLMFVRKLSKTEKNTL